MKYVFSVLAVLSAPVLYGVVCVPVVGLLLSANPDLLNDQGGTKDIGLIVQVELVQLLMLSVIGFVVAAIARFKPMLHAVIATVLMLLIGVSVQISFWDAMPVWHHFVFFTLIVVGISAGAYMNVRVLSGKQERNGSP